MDRIQSFAEDQAEIISEEFRAGRLSRRQMLAGLGALGLAAAAPGVAPCGATSYGEDQHHLLMQPLHPVAIRLVCPFSDAEEPHLFTSRHRWLLQVTQSGQLGQLLAFG